jgi:hypothetical protein
VRLHQTVAAESVGQLGAKVSTPDQAGACRAVWRKQPPVYLAPTSRRNLTTMQARMRLLMPMARIAILHGKP